MTLEYDRFMYNVSQRCNFSDGQIAKEAQYWTTHNGDVQKMDLRGGVAEQAGKCKKPFRG